MAPAPAAQPALRTFPSVAGSGRKVPPCAQMLPLLDIVDPQRAFSYHGTERAGRKRDEVATFPLWNGTMIPKKVPFHCGLAIDNRLALSDAARQHRRPIEAAAAADGAAADDGGASGRRAAAAPRRAHRGPAAGPGVDAEGAGGENPRRSLGPPPLRAGARLPPSRRPRPPQRRLRGDGRPPADRQGSEAA